MFFFSVGRSLFFKCIKMIFQVQHFLTLRLGKWFSNLASIFIIVTTLSIKICSNEARFKLWQHHLRSLSFLNRSVTLWAISLKKSAFFIKTLTWEEFWSYSVIIKHNLNGTKDSNKTFFWQNSLFLAMSLFMTVWRLWRVTATLTNVANIN